MSQVFISRGTNLGEMSEFDPPWEGWYRFRWLSGILQGLVDEYYSGRDGGDGRKAEVVPQLYSTRNPFGMSGRFVGGARYAVPFVEGGLYAFDEPLLRNGDMHADIRLGRHEKVVKFFAGIKEVSYLGDGPRGVCPVRTVWVV